MGEDKDMDKKIIREKIIKTLIESGIKVDVFGDSWKKSPYADNKNLKDISLHKEKFTKIHFPLTLGVKKMQNSRHNLVCSL